ncbi:MAG: ATP-binding protein [Myxococcota bacterium]
MRSGIHLSKHSALLVCTAGTIAASILLACATLVASVRTSSGLVLLVVFVVLEILMASGLAYLGSRSVEMDLGAMADAVRAMARGGRKEPVPLRSMDELGELAQQLESLRTRFIEGLAREREALQRAEEADRYKADFLTALSHELRTPLNAILGFADVLLNEIDGPISEGQREDLQIVKTAGVHLISLFNDVLDLSAATSGRLELVRQRVPLGPMLDETVALFAAQRGEKQRTLTIDRFPGLPDVDADPTRLRQILSNLTSNALKFTPEGSIVLRARPDRSWVLVEVQDTGVGIAPEEIPLIFQEFGQVRGESRRHRGTGLGLAITKQLVELHGGQVRVESRIGVGSTFSFSLPIWRGIAEFEADLIEMSTHDDR